MPQPRGGQFDSRTQNARSHHGLHQTKVWNRVALHHLMYRNLRDQFPEMGSQMVCNAIYSVSRTCREWSFQFSDGQEEEGAH